MFNSFVVYLDLKIVLQLFLKIYVKDCKQYVSIVFSSFEMCSALMNKSMKYLKICKVENSYTAKHKMQLLFEIFTKDTLIDPD